MTKQRPNLKQAAHAKAAEPLRLTLTQLVNTHEAQRAELGLGLRLRKWADPETGLGAFPAWEITSAQLHKAALAMLEAGYSPSSINRDMSALGQVYKWAVEDRRFAPVGFVSPTKSVPRLAEQIRRVDFDDNELRRLRDAALSTRDRAFTLFVWCLADTGARKSELLDRSWHEFDLERGEIEVPKTKNGQPRQLIMSRDTIELARALCPPESVRNRLVWPGKRYAYTPIDYRKPWSKLVASIGHDGLHMHDVRHAVASSLIRAGVSVAVAAQTLGHRDHTMLTRRYGHMDTRDIKAAQAKRLEIA